MHVYITEEIKELIKEIKNNEPNFNISKFCQDAIKQKIHGGKNINIDDILSDIQKCKLEIKKQEIKLELLDKLEKRYYIEQEIEKQRVTEERKKEKENEKRKKIAIENGNEIAMHELGRNLTENEINDYYYNNSDSIYKSIYSFIDKLKEVKK